MNRVTEVAYRLLPLAALVGLHLLLRNNAFWSGATWTLLLYLSLLGWGFLVERLVRSPRRVDIGLRASWGMAATLGVGGTAAMFHIASKPFLVTQIVVGCALAAVARATDRKRRATWRSITATLTHATPFLVVFACAILVVFALLGQLATPPSNVSDDQALYVFLAEKLVQTGSFLDPFDVRRITSYGGQFYLHAQYLVSGAPYQLNVIDGGLGAIVVFTQVVNMIAPRSLRRADAGHLGIVLLVFLTILSVRFNIGSLLTGVAMGLGTYRTFVWADAEAHDEPRLPLRHIALIAACAAATCLFRTSNFVAITMFVGGALILRRSLLVRRFEAESIRGALIAGGFFVIALAPWLVMFRESVGTFVYPLSRGNLTAGFVVLKSEPGLVFNLKHLIGDLGHDRPLVASLLFLLAGLAPLAARSKRRLDLVPLMSVICCVGIVIVSYAGGAFEDWVNSRYYFAFLVWTAIIVATSVRSERRASWTASSRGAIVLVVCAIHIVIAHEEIKKRLYADIDSCERAVTNAAAESQANDWKTQEYRDVQYRLPAGSTIAVAVADPFRFDMRRNVIFSLDQPGGMGPDGGFPVFQGPEAFAHYLVSHGVRYFIAMSFHTPHELYDIDRWRRHKLLEHSFLAYDAPIQVDAMESIEALEKSRRVVYHQFDLFAVDITGHAE